MKIRRRRVEQQPVVSDAASEIVAERKSDAEDALEAAMLELERAVAKMREVALGGVEK